MILQDNSLIYLDRFSIFVLIRRNMTFKLRVFQKLKTSYLGYMRVVQMWEWPERLSPAPAALTATALTVTLICPLGGAWGVT